ncbi:MAG: hypothetical protein ACI9ND_003423, partial [Yoonia sp.]
EHVSPRQRSIKHLLNAIWKRINQSGLGSQFNIGQLFAIGRDHMPVFRFKLQNINAKSLCSS